ncbi:MAG TPA: GNAT family N-acetyltransferase [Trebonia sp.]
MITVGKLAAADRADWERLFRGYISFYEQDHPQSMYDRAWAEFQADTRMHAFGAWLDGTLAGITHFLVHPSTTAPDVCYLEDLYTAPEHRGHGVARALIAGVGEWAAERGCGYVYWQTREDNAAGRRLYDQVAAYRGFIVYTMRLPPGDGG